MEEEGDLKVLELNNGVREREKYLELLHWSPYLFKEEEVAYIVLLRNGAV